MIDPATEIGRVRLLTGDITATPFFEDHIYQYYLDQGEGEVGSAIAIVEAMASAFALMPERERVGHFETYNISLSFLDSRLDELKKKRYGTQSAPMIIRAGQDSWDRVSNIFFDD